MKTLLALLVLSFSLVAACAAAQQQPTPPPDGQIAQAPVYRVGDNWQMSRSGRLLSATVDKIEGERVYVNYGGDGHDVYTLDGNWIEWIGPSLVIPGQKFVGEASSPYIQSLSFPLYVGKSWFQRYALHGNFDPVLRTLDVKVAAYEQVTTSAGDTFWAFRLEATDRGYNTYHRTYWYAPSVRWIVKSVSDLPVWNTELIWTGVK